MAIPLNQTYRRAATFAAYPQLHDTYSSYVRWAETTPHARCHYAPHGRAYDAALTVFQVDFEGANVAELGARGSLFGCYLTKMANRVVVSDDFVGWPTLGTREECLTRWMASASRPDRLAVETRDLRDTRYADDEFDVAVCFSAIEHIRGGDVQAAFELGRIVKPGGFVALSVECCREHMWTGSSYYYDHRSLFHRVIVPSGCTLVGPGDFSMAGATDRGTWQCEWRILRNENPGHSFSNVTEDGRVEWASAFLLLQKAGGL